MNSKIHNEFKSVLRVFIGITRSIRTLEVLCFMCARQREKTHPLPIPLNTFKLKINKIQWMESLSYDIKLRRHLFLGYEIDKKPFPIRIEFKKLILILLKLLSRVDHKPVKIKYKTTRRRTSIFFTFRKDKTSRITITINLNNVQFVTRSHVFIRKQTMVQFSKD